RPRRRGAPRAAWAGAAGQLPPEPAEHQHGTPDPSHARGGLPARAGPHRSHGELGDMPRTFPDDPKPWKVLSRAYISRKFWYTVHVDKVELPTGAVIDEYFVNEA